MDRKGSAKGLGAGASQRATAPPRSEWPYPYYSLPSVLEFATLVRRLGGNEAAEERVLEEMGVNTRTTRSWSYRLSSAKEFGLIKREGRKGDARLRLTELCLRLLEATGPAAHATRMRVFLTPRLYAALRERFSGSPTPTSEALVKLLVKEFNLIESVALRAAEAFLESARFAGAITEGGHVTSAPATGTSRKPSVEPSSCLIGEKRDGSAEANASSTATPADFVAHEFQLRRGVTISLALPSDLNQGDVARLQRWLRTLPFDELEGE